MTKPALVTDHLVLRPATGEAEIDQLRQALNQGHYLKVGRSAGHVLWPTNWQPLGFTKGLKRHRRDFYQDAGKPKHLWIRPRKKDALVLLARPGLLPPAHQAIRPPSPMATPPAPAAPSNAPNCAPSATPC